METSLLMHESPVVKPDWLGFDQEQDVCDFPEKRQKRAKFIKIGQNCTKLENIFKSGSLMPATMACMKQLEYALRSLPQTGNRDIGR